MIESEIVSGQQYAWSLVKKIAEGYTGEVFLAESLMDKRAGIVKRPHRSAFASDAVRQAAQLKTEARILKSLSAAFDLDPIGVAVPALIDQSKPGADFTDRFFIVIEPALGIDLAAMRRDRRIPDHLLLVVISRLFETFDRIHAYPIDTGSGEAYGVLWNDFKLEHLWWDADRQLLTLIDWSNGGFLQADGKTEDRLYAAEHDQRQMISTFAHLFEADSPELAARLGWLSAETPRVDENEWVDGLRQRVQTALEEEAAGLQDARRSEAKLLQPGGLSVETLPELDEIHRQIGAYGALPDCAGAQRAASALATMAVVEDRLDDLQTICRWAATLPQTDRARWELAAKLARIPARSSGDERQCFLDSLQAAVCGDWLQALWQLASAVRRHAEPTWWFDLSGEMRRLALGVEGESLRPAVLVSRFALALQSRQRYQADATPDETQHALLAAAERRLREAVIPNWSKLELDPPHSSLVYSEIDAVLDELAEVIPLDVQPVERGLAQPRAQVRLALDAWERQDFLTASKVLRRLLAWDPDRRRVLSADTAIAAAPGWLKRIHIGPARGGSLLEFITTLEFEGREMRNQVGAASWLDTLLDALRQLRRGTYPTDLLAAQPEIAREIPWLSRFGRGEAAQDRAGDQPAAEVVPLALETVRGETTGTLGSNRDLSFATPLDAWVPEARGSSARVLLGSLRAPGGELRPAAIKLMRTDKVDYAMPLFKEEALIMQKMIGVPGMTPMLECGFIRLDDGDGLPSDLDARAAGLTGSLERLAPDRADDFVARIDEYTANGWIPYLAFYIRRNQDNLLTLCDAGLNHGTFLPVPDLLQMTIQICDIIDAAHQRNIVYRDHKILHYYWEESSNGVYIIDWNVARLHEGTLDDIEKQMDLVQFGARGLHHILTGRAAPGALPLGPTRPDEIDGAAQTYRPQWTYDDRRLSDDVKAVIEKVLEGSYTHALDLREDLKRAMIKE